jgi:hypothetical protein
MIGARLAFLGVSFGFGVLAARVWETPEERLARRFVAAERALETCQEKSPPKAGETRQETIVREVLNDMMCAAERDERRAAEIAAELWKRSR